MRFHAFLALAIAGIAGRTIGRTDCRCNGFGESSPVLITTGHGGPTGLVVCGYLERRRGSIVRASEFEVARCRDGTTALEFDATETADVEAQGDDLRVTRVSMWPIGPDWAWEYLPIATAVVRAAQSGTPQWRPVLTRPVVSARQVQEFLSRYTRPPGHDYPPSTHMDEVVGKLFVAGLTGDTVAQHLFCRMSQDIPLGGAAAENYDSALRDLMQGTEGAAWDSASALNQDGCLREFQMVRAQVPPRSGQ